MAGTEGYRLQLLRSLRKESSMRFLFFRFATPNPLCFATQNRGFKSDLNQDNKLDIKPSLLSWLGRRDSNPRIPGPKPGALPLGHVPINFNFHILG